MSKHVSYRGTTIDMESLSRENEKTVAVGNMKTNARGDEIDKGMVTKTADQIARENHRVQSVVVQSSLKGKQPIAPDFQPDQAKPARTQKQAPVNKKETEMPSGDIVIEDDDAN